MGKDWLEAALTAKNPVVADRYDRRKIFYHPAAIASLLGTGDCWPVTVNTGFTTYCNHSCIWCSSAYTTRVEPSLKQRDELLIDPEVWIRNIHILAARGTKGLIVAGQGEPLLHPKAADMLAAAADANLKFMLFTNGERLHEKYTDALFRGAVAVRFSVDAATPELHVRWHGAANANGSGRANFAAVVGNIRKLVDEKRRRGAILPHIGCQMICSSLTESDFEGFARLFGEIGADYVAYKSLQRSNANEGLVVTAADLHAGENERAVQARGMLDKLLDIKRRYETEHFAVHVKADQIAQAYVKRFNGGERYPKCLAHPLTPMIEPDGKVYLCIDHGGSEEFVIGNIYNADIDKIWASPQRQSAIARIDLKRKCPAGCFLDETNRILNELASPDPNVHHMLI